MTVLSERRPTPLGPVAFAFAVVFAQTLMMFVNFAVVAPLLLPEGTSVYEPTPAAFAVLLILAPIETALVVGGAVYFGRTSLAALGWARPTLRDLGLGAIGFVALATWVVGAMAFYGTSVTETLASWTEPLLAERSLWVLIGFTAAFSEETVFRGMLQPALVAKLGRWPGIVLAAFVFSLYHLPHSPVQIVSRTVLGVVYGVLKDRTGRLMPSAIAHWLSWLIIGAN